MFYSFMTQTLSCVQISSFHCLQYLKEEQTAGSSLEVSIEDLFYFISFFFLHRKIPVSLYSKAPGNASILPISYTC